MSPASLLFTTSKAKELAHFSKPHKNEAFLRLRNSTLSLVTLVLLTYLLPVPSLWTAFNFVRGECVVDAFWAICAAGTRTARVGFGLRLRPFYFFFPNTVEIVLSGLLALNFVQAAIAIRYPRSPLPSLPSPAKNALTPQGQKKRRAILSPGTSPQTQRSFSSSYVPSPVSTPSRTLHYSVPSTPSPFGASLGVSTSTAPSTPSPSLAAYHGKHPPSLGRSLFSAYISNRHDAHYSRLSVLLGAFTGSTLSRLADDSDDDNS
ncbi:hypothetical protein JVU11DRAFT_12620 [Chiua virens]|nr:hypothetical protein JVU11DRAFT_12620 [Chiua virens]